MRFLMMIFWALSLVLPVSVATAQGPLKEAKDPAKQKKGPQAEFESQTFRFGKLRAGVEVKHDFLFKNTGEEDFVIRDVKVGCSCVVMGQFDAIVKPGETGKIQVSLDTARLEHKVSKPIQVLTNSSESPAITLRVAGEVWQPFKVTPSAAVFSRVDGKRRKSKKINIKNLLPRDVKLVSVTCDSEAFSVSVREVKEGKNFELEVATVPPLTDPSLHAEITILTDDLEVPKITIAAVAHVTLPVAVTPTNLRFPSEVVAPTKRFVYVRHARGKPFKIEGVEFDDTHLRVNIIREKKASRGYKIMVTATPDLKIGKDGLEVSIKTNVEGARSISFVVRQHAKDPATLSRKQFRPTPARTGSSKKNPSAEPPKKD